MVSMRCTTPGASIAYTTGTRWRLYSGPVKVAAGEKLRAIACRLGYLDSEEVAE
jgi:hypothetical protein